MSGLRSVLYCRYADGTNNVACRHMSYSQYFKHDLIYVGSISGTLLNYRRDPMSC